MHQEAGRGRTPYIPTHGPAKPGQILGPKVQIPLATPRPAQTLQPRPFYPGPAGRNIGGGTPKGGLITGLAEIGGQMLIPHISREAVRGAFVVTGQDTTTLDNLNAGRPVVVNIDGTSYNITTPEGLAAAQKARAAGGKKTIPAVSPKPTASLSETPPKPLQEETPAPKPAPTPAPAPTPTPAPTPAPTGPTQETTRTNKNGIEQKGKDLSSVNSGLSAVGVGPLEDMGRFFTEGFIPGVKGQDSSTNMGFDSPNAETGTWSEEEGRIIEPSAGSATGGKPENVQDGTSPNRPLLKRFVRSVVHVSKSLLLALVTAPLSSLMKLLQPADLTQCAVLQEVPS